MEKTAFFIYLLVLILSTLLFGAVHTYAYTLMTVGVFAATSLLLAKSVRKHYRTRTYHLHLPGQGLSLFFLLVLALLVFQLLPWPAVFVHLVSPEAYHVRQMGVPAAGVIDGSAHGPAWLSLAPYLYPIRMSMVRFLVYGFFFFGLSRVLRTQKRLEKAVFVILALGCFETLYGLIQAFGGSGHIWWYWRGTSDVTGTFINRNHFAALMEMGILLAAGFAAGLSDRVRRHPASVGRPSTWRGRVARMLSGEQLFNKRLFVLFAGVVMGIGVIFSASRGGMVATAAGMLLMAILYALRRRHRGKSLLLFLLFLLTAIYAVEIGVERPLSRFKNLFADMQSRERYARKTLELFKDYPAVGVGLGNFQYAYPRYQAAEDQKGYIRFAHNDWAQFLAEAGVMGLTLLVLGLTVFLFRTLRLWSKRGDPFAVCLGITHLPVVAAMALHAVGEFNLHIPANGLLLAAVLAIGDSALHLERRRGRDRTLHRTHLVPLKVKGALVLGLIVGFMLLTAIWAIRHFVAETYCNTVPNSTLQRDPQPPLHKIGAATAWDPGNAAYWNKLAHAWIRIRDREGRMEVESTPHDAAEKLSRVGENLEQANSRVQHAVIRAMEQAVQHNPLEAQYHLRLGWEYTRLWQEADYHARWLPAADLSMDRAAYFAGVKTPRLHVELGNYWVMRSKTLDPLNPERDTAWEKAVAHYRVALRLEDSPKLQEEIKGYVWMFYPDTGIIAQIMGE